MCLDVEGQLLYVLGRYLDPASRAQLGDSTHSLTIPVSVTGKGEEGREEEGNRGRRERREEGTEGGVNGGRRERREEGTEGGGNRGRRERREEGRKGTKKEGNGEKEGEGEGGETNDAVVSLSAEHFL